MPPTDRELAYVLKADHAHHRGYTLCRADDDRQRPVHGHCKKHARDNDDPAHAPIQPSDERCANSYQDEPNSHDGENLVLEDEKLAYIADCERVGRE